MRRNANIPLHPTETLPCIDGGESTLFYEVKEYKLAPLDIQTTNKWFWPLTLDWFYRIPIGHGDIMDLMVQQTKNKFPGEIPDGTVIEFMFNFKNKSTKSVKMPDYMKDVSVPNEIDTFMVNGKVRFIETSLLSVDSGFDFDLYNNANAVNEENQHYVEIHQLDERPWCDALEHSNYAVIEKPAILENFPGNLRSQIIIRVVTGDQPQEMNAFRARDVRITVNVPGNLTFLFDKRLIEQNQHVFAAKKCGGMVLGAFILFLVICLWLIIFLANDFQTAV